MLNFRDPINACTGSRLAATFTGFFTRRAGDDRIDDADIVTNPNVNFSVPADNCSGSKFRLEGVMVHEVGHLLGLGHTNVEGATVFPSVSPCNNGPASTANDDEAAIRNLYASATPERSERACGLPALLASGPCLRSDFRNRPIQGSDRSRVL